ncbi:MAG: hypothetical protein KDD00_17580, partial [Ignavibacteriae bacterium]|nr:hypothetical protein [Ignavibacteriota bacterium]
VSKPYSFPNPSLGRSNYSEFLLTKLVRHGGLVSRDEVLKQSLLLGEGLGGLGEGLKLRILNVMALPVSVMSDFIFKLFYLP